MHFRPFLLVNLDNLILKSIVFSHSNVTFTCDNFDSFDIFHVFHLLLYIVIITLYGPTFYIKYDIIFTDSYLCLRIVMFVLTLLFIDFSLFDSDISNLFKCDMLFIFVFCVVLNVWPNSLWLFLIVLKTRH